MGCSDSTHEILPVDVEEDAGNNNLSFKVSFSMVNIWVTVLYLSCVLVNLDLDFLETCSDFSHWFKSSIEIQTKLKHCAEYSEHKKYLMKF